MKIWSRWDQMGTKRITLATISERPLRKFVFGVSARGQTGGPQGGSGVRVGDAAEEEDGPGLGVADGEEEGVVDADFEGFGWV
jgi:hypothetical protein